MSTFPAASYLSNASRSEGEMKQALEDQLAATKQIPGSGITETTLTLASDTVTLPAGGGGIFSIDTEAAAASDDLKNIVQTNFPDGSVVVIRAVSAARLVKVWNAAGGGGQIMLKTGGDFTLGDPSHWLLLKRTGTNWDEILRAPGAELAPVLGKTGSYTTTAADRGRLIDCTSGTFTVTLLPGAIAGRGFEQPIRNAGAGIVTVDGNAAETVDGVSAITLQPGDQILLVCDGSNWKSYCKYTPAVGSYKVVANTSANNGTTPNTQMDLIAHQVVVYSVNFRTSMVHHTPGILTCNISTAGPAANGRDQAGAFSASSWVYFYWIWSGGQLATLASATPPPTGPTLPGGYTHWAFSHSAPLDGSGNLRRIRVRGSWVYYDTKINVLANANSGIEAGVSVNTTVPPNALSMLLRAELRAVGSVTNAVSGAQATFRHIPGSIFHEFAISSLQQSGGQTRATDQFMMTNFGQGFYYAATVIGSVSAIALDVDVQAYQIPNGGE